jgi:hypothetical protein
MTAIEENESEDEMSDAEQDDSDDFEESEP